MSGLPYFCAVLALVGITASAAVVTIKPGVQTTIYLEEADPRDLRCPTGIMEHLDSYDGIETIARKLNYSPECMWRVIKWLAKTRAPEVRGFSFGAVSEVSNGVGVGFSTELVLMRYDAETLMVGQVYIRTYDAALSLPGVSATQSVIFGNCPAGISSYLGWFDSISGVAMTRSYGKRAYAPPLLGGYSGCDAITVTVGSTSPAAGISQSNYSQVERSVFVTGPRVAPLLRYLETLNRTTL